MVTSYICPICDFVYTDHGPDSPLGAHRRRMAALRVATWEEAEQLIASANARVVSEDPSWEGQECGDRSAQPVGSTGCMGRLIRLVVQ